MAVDPNPPMPRPTPQQEAAAAEELATVLRQCAAGMLASKAPPGPGGQATHIYLTRDTILHGAAALQHYQAAHALEQAQLVHPELLLVEQELEALRAAATAAAKALQQAATPRPARPSTLPDPDGLEAELRALLPAALPSTSSTGELVFEFDTPAEALQLHGLLQQLVSPTRVAADADSATSQFTALYNLAQVSWQRTLLRLQWPHHSNASTALDCLLKIMHRVPPSPAPEPEPTPTGTPTPPASSVPPAVAPADCATRQQVGEQLQAMLRPPAALSWDDQLECVRVDFDTAGGQARWNALRARWQALRATNQHTVQTVLGYLLTRSDVRHVMGSLHNRLYVGTPGHPTAGPRTQMYYGMLLQYTGRATPPAAGSMFAPVQPEPEPATEQSAPVQPESAQAPATRIVPKSDREQVGRLAALLLESRPFLCEASPGVTLFGGSVAEANQLLNLLTWLRDMTQLGATYLGSQAVEVGRLLAEFSLQREPGVKVWLGHQWQGAEPLEQAKALCAALRALGETSAPADAVPRAT